MQPTRSDVIPEVLKYSTTLHHAASKERIQIPELHCAHSGLFNTYPVNLILVDSRRKCTRDLVMLPSDRAPTLQALSLPLTARRSRGNETAILSVSTLSERPRQSCLLCPRGIALQDKGASHSVDSGWKSTAPVDDSRIPRISLFVFQIWPKYIARPVRKGRATTKLLMMQPRTS